MTHPARTTSALALLIPAIGAFAAPKINGEIFHNVETIRQLDLIVGVAYAPDLTTAADCVPAQAELYQTLVEEFRTAGSRSFPQREIRMLKAE